MPEDNIEILRRGIDAFNSRDVQRLIEFFDPDIVLHSTFAAAMAGIAVYHGHDGVRRWHQDLEETWSGIRLELRSVSERGDHLLALYRMHGRGRQSGADVAMPVAHLMQLRDGCVIWLKTSVEPDVAIREFEAIPEVAS